MAGFIINGSIFDSPIGKRPISAVQRSQKQRPVQRGAVRLSYDYGYNGAKDLGHGKDGYSDGQKLSDFAFQNG